MGYTSQKVPRKTFTASLALREVNTVTEASKVEYFSIPMPRLKQMFPFVEICDNGKVYLRDREFNGDFVCLEKGK